MIEIICNKDESDKNSHHVKEGVTGIRRPKNIKQIGDVSSDKKNIHRRLCVYIHQFYCI